MEERWNLPGTTLIKAVNPEELTDVNGTLFFTSDDGETGFELWSSNGTSAGTQLVRDINPNEATNLPGYLTNVSGTLFFAADDGTNGGELWKSDGTSEGTMLVKDIVSGEGSSIFATPATLLSGFGPGFVNVNGTVFFAADDGVHGRELWKSDGTSEGTTLVKDIRVGSEDSTSQLVISGRRGTLRNYLITTAESVNGTLFFTATDGISGFELWKSDGTSAGTTLVKDIREGSMHSYPRNLTNVNGTLFFTAVDGINGTEVWESDGTSAGTTPIKDIRAGGQGSAPNLLTNVNSTLFFSADDGINGDALWKSTDEDVPFRIEQRLAVGADAGGSPLVEVYDAAGNLLFGFFAYDSNFAGGVHVATGDFNGDFVEDIVTGAGAGGGPHVRIFDGVTGALITEFFAYDGGFLGGVFVAVGDLDKDGSADIITGAGAGGGPHVRAFSGAGKGTLADFFAYDPSFSGGVTVAIADLDFDGFGDIITGPGAGGGPNVRIFSGGGKGILADFFAFDPGFTGGVSVSAGDLNNNGFVDILVGAGTGGGPHVRAFAGEGLGAPPSFVIADFFAFDPGFTGGVPRQFDRP